MKIWLLAYGFILLSATVSAKDNLATSFINDVINSADTGESISSSIDVECLAPSASGKLLITKADYEFGKTNGVFVFKEDSATPVKAEFMTTVSPGDDFTSDVVLGLAFGFKMSSGQFFVDIFKDNKARAGVNKSGETAVKWINCKIVSPT